MFQAAVRHPVQVTAIEREAGSQGYAITTPQGVYQSPKVVIATGLFQKPKLPNFSTAFPVKITQLAACLNPDILINNAGGPPPDDFRRATREEWIRAIDANMLPPIFLIRAVLDGMVARGFGRILNITTSGVKSPGIYPQLGISIGVRSGLTGFVGVLSRQVASHNVTINGLLPGTLRNGPATREPRIRGQSGGPSDRG